MSHYTHIPSDFKHLLFLCLVSIWFGTTSVFITTLFACILYSPSLIYSLTTSYRNELFNEFIQLYAKIKNTQQTQSVVSRILGLLKSSQPEF